MSLMLGKLLLWSLRKHFWDRIAIARWCPGIITGVDKRRRVV
jgi:hypothetical protein